MCSFQSAFADKAQVDVGPTVVVTAVEHFADALDALPQHLKLLQPILETLGEEQQGLTSPAASGTRRGQLLLR